MMLTEYTAISDRLKKLRDDAEQNGQISVSHAYQDALEIVLDVADGTVKVGPTYLGQSFQKTDMTVTPRMKLLSWLLSE